VAQPKIANNLIRARLAPHSQSTLGAGSAATSFNITIHSLTLRTLAYGETGLADAANKLFGDSTQRAQTFSTSLLL
jgi:hypothetical protein